MGLAPQIPNSPPSPHPQGLCSYTKPDFPPKLLQMHSFHWHQSLLLSSVIQGYTWLFMIIIPMTHVLSPISITMPSLLALQPQYTIYIPVYSEKLHFCCFSHAVCAIPLRQPEPTKPPCLDFPLLQLLSSCSSLVRT